MRLRSLLPPVAVSLLLAAPAYASGPGPEHGGAGGESKPSGRDGAEPSPPEAEGEAEPKPEAEPEAPVVAASRAADSGPARRPAAPKRAAKAELCDYRTPVHEHVVRPGEHLGSVAGRYGVFSADVLRWNPELADPNLIVIGQRLRVCPEIPPREELVLSHTIAAGETLGGIALSYGLTLPELLALQGDAIEDPNRVRTGTKLHIETLGEILPDFRPDPEPEAARGGARVSRRFPSRPWTHVKRPNLAWGTPRTIELLDHALRRYHERVGGPKVNVGDISRRHGGRIDGHVSHRRGVDVDLGLVLAGEHAGQTRFVDAGPGSLDVARTWALVESLLESGEVRYIFLDHEVQGRLYEYARSHGVSERKLDEYFQYPRGPGRNHGIVRHWKGHRNHLHVRFR
jgi:LysM repeat protein